MSSDSQQNDSPSLDQILAGIKELKSLGSDFDNQCDHLEGELPSFRAQTNRIEEEVKQIVGDGLKQVASVGDAYIDLLYPDARKQP